VLSNSQKVTLAATLGTGILVGAAGVAVYQRLNKNVSLNVTGKDFHQEIATLTTSIERLRQDIEELKSSESPVHTARTVQRTKPLKSALKKCNRTSSTELQQEETFTNGLELPSHSRNLSWGSTRTSVSSSSTEYFSAISSDEDDLNDFSTPEADPANSLLETLVGDDNLLNIFTRVDDLMEGSRDQQLLSLNILEEKTGEFGDNAAYLGRLCKAQYLCSVLADQTEEPGRRKELILAAVETGAKALEKDNTNPEVHKWYAIALGSRGEFSGVKEKILDGFEFKKHIDTAARLAPRDYVTHHLLGRFCYEVSQLSWIERKMASTLFANPPEASLPEAIDHFLMAESLKPDGWKENRLFLAKCHIGLGDYVEAMTWLDKADAIPIASDDIREGIKDRISQEEIDILLEKYEKYRC